MGGLTIYELVLRMERSFDAVLLFAPTIMINPNEKIFTLIAGDRRSSDKYGYCAYYFDKLQTDKYPMNPDQSTVCSNLEAIRNMREDKLNITSYTIQSSAHMLFDAMSKIKESELDRPSTRVMNFDVPFCYFQGGKDMLVNSTAQNILISHAESKR